MRPRRARRFFGHRRQEGHSSVENDRQNTHSNGFAVSRNHEESLGALMHKPFKTTLSNGLRVLLLESRTAPVVSWNLWANVGSVNETDDEAGLCHLIEHMIFKGTGRRPVGQIAKEV